MCEEFIASLGNLTYIEDRQRVKAELARLPSNMMVSIRGMYDDNIHSLTLMNVWVMGESEYTHYHNRGGRMVFVPVSLYKELNQC